MYCELTYDASQKQISLRKRNDKIKTDIHLFYWSRVNTNADASHSIKYRVVRVLFGLGPSWIWIGCQCIWLDGSVRRIQLIHMYLVGSTKKKSWTEMQYIVKFTQCYVAPYGPLCARQLEKLARTRLPNGVQAVASLVYSMKTEKCQVLDHFAQPTACQTRANIIGP